MSKFCKYCGKEIEEGAVCDCAASAETAAPEVPAAPAAPAPAPQPSKAGTYFSNIWKLFLAVIKKPVTIGSAFVKSADTKTAWGLIGINAVAVGLLLLTYVLEFNNIIKDGVGSFGEMSREAMRMLDRSMFPAGTTFFVGVVATVAMACLLPAVIMLVARMFKKETTYKNMLCASGINSLVMTPFVLVGVILGFICKIELSVSSVIWAIVLPMLISSIGITLATYVTLKIVPAGSTATDDEMPYIMFITTIIMSIAFYIVMTTCTPMCLPEIAKDADSLGEALEGVFERIF